MWNYSHRNNWQSKIWNKMRLTGNVIKWEHSKFGTYIRQFRVTKMGTSENVYLAQVSFTFHILPDMIRFLYRFDLTCPSSGNDINNSKLQERQEYKYETHGHPNVYGFDVWHTRQRRSSAGALRSQCKHSQQPNGHACRRRLNVEPEVDPW